MLLLLLSLLVDFIVVAVAVAVATFAVGSVVELMVVTLAVVMIWM